MDKLFIKNLFLNFEEYVQNIWNWAEFWLARDLQKLFWYTKWDNFLNIISKSIDYCNTIWYNHSENFVYITKSVKLWEWNKKEISDIVLTRYACYLISHNINVDIEQKKFAQIYFSLKNRKLEIIEEIISNQENETNKNNKKNNKYWNIVFQNFDYQNIEEKKDNLYNENNLFTENSKIILKAKDFDTELIIYNNMKLFEEKNKAYDKYVKKNKTFKEKSFEFSLNIVKLYNFICENKKENLINNKLFESWTIVWILINESKYSKNIIELLDKLYQIDREVNNAYYCLELLKKSWSISDYPHYDELEKNNKELLKIISLMIKKIKNNYPLKGSFK